MKPHLGRNQLVAVWLGVSCLGLLSLSPLSAQEPKLRDTLQGHTDSVWSVAFSPDGKTLASGGSHSTIKLWDVQTGKETATLKGHKASSVGCLAFDRDGDVVVPGALVPVHCDTAHDHAVYVEPNVWVRHDL